LPAIYENEFYVRDGGLMSYGTDADKSFTRAAALADRILKGTKPDELPLSNPRATALSSTSRLRKPSTSQSPTLLARADEVIE